MKVTKICRICGKEYEYCKTWRPFTGNRWQDVACSPECAAKYFAAVEASRNGNSAPAVAEPVLSPAKEVEETAEEIVEEIAAEPQEEPEAEQEETEDSFSENLCSFEQSSLEEHAG